MKRPKLDLKPKHTKLGRGDWWFYEETNGLHVVHDYNARESQGLQRVDGFRIPLASIRAYLRRLDGRR